MAGVDLLCIERTRITDAGLTNLKGMKNLHCILADGTAITDAGLAPLKDAKEFPNLDRIWCVKSKVTKAGADDLKKARGKGFMVVR